MLDTLFDQLRGALLPALVLERELGGGGMSRVFVAREPALDRDLVVKVLHPDFAGSVNADRFTREIQLAARLQHPHIVPILATGNVGGLPFFTMPFVRGRSLRDALSASAHTPFPIEEATSILRDVARALAFAHEHGIVHRDIKPDNVLLAGGAAAVTDFGIAKAISTSRGDRSADADATIANDSLTVVGSSIGTPHYMSPEQVAGDPGIDHRSDIYSWGVLAYELLAGRPPFEDGSTQKILMAHMVTPPTHILERRPDCPEALATLVMEALAKDPDERPQSAGEVARRLTGGAAAPTASRTSTGGPRDEGRAAYAGRDWATAAPQLRTADTIQPLDAEHLEMLGEAELAAGHFAAAERARERAYVAYTKAGAPQAAARVACALALEHVVRGRAPVAMGWMETAAKALQEQPECEAQGQLTWLKAQATLVFEGDAEGGLRLAEQVIAIGRRLGSVDVEMMGLGTAGRALVRLGADHVQQGLAYLDTAMASATTGILRASTSKYIVCNLLCGCHELGDYRRAGDWCDAADASTARLSLEPAAGDCHVHRATLLRVRGDWDGAEGLARQGMQELEGETFHSSLALYEIGEVRLRRGDFEGAATAFRDAQEHGHSGQPGLAQLALAQGMSAVARSMIEGALDDTRTPLLRAALLPVAVDAAVASHDLERARANAAELSAIAAAYHTPALLATEASANGAVALAAGDARAAGAHLRRAVKAWRELRMPYEGACARASLAAAHAAGDDLQSAQTELAAARSVFERLGAVRELKRVESIP
jgi:tRNA A-37 threonylcarbamoyl transferase component Bud32